MQRRWGWGRQRIVTKARLKLLANARQPHIVAQKFHQLGVGGCSGKMSPHTLGERLDPGRIITQGVDNACRQRRRLPVTGQAHICEGGKEITTSKHKVRLHSGRTGGCQPVPLHNRHGARRRPLCEPDCTQCSAVHTTKWRVFIILGVTPKCVVQGQHQLRHRRHHTQLTRALSPAVHVRPVEQADPSVAPTIARVPANRS